MMGFEVDSCVEDKTPFLDLLLVPMVLMESSGGGHLWKGHSMSMFRRKIKRRRFDLWELSL